MPKSLEMYTDIDCQVHLPKLNIKPLKIKCSLVGELGFSGDIKANVLFGSATKVKDWKEMLLYQKIENVKISTDKGRTVVYFV